MDTTTIASQNVDNSTQTHTFTIGTPVKIEKIAERVANKNGIDIDYWLEGTLAADITICEKIMVKRIMRSDYFGGGGFNKLPGWFETSVVKNIESDGNGESLIVTTANSTYRVSKNSGRN